MFRNLTQRDPTLLSTSGSKAPVPNHPELQPVEECMIHVRKTWPSLLSENFNAIPLALDMLQDEPNNKKLAVFEGLIARVDQAMDIIVNTYSDGLKRSLSLFNGILVNMNDSENLLKNISTEIANQSDQVKKHHYDLQRYWVQSCQLGKLLELLSVIENVRLELSSIEPEQLSPQQAYHFANRIHSHSAILSDKQLQSIDIFSKIEELVENKRKVLINYLDTALINLIYDDNARASSATYFISSFSEIVQRGRKMNLDKSGINTADLHHLLMGLNVLDQLMPTFKNVYVCFENNIRRIFDQIVSKNLVSFQDSCLSPSALTLSEYEKSISDRLVAVFVDLGGNLASILNVFSNILSWLKLNRPDLTAQSPFHMKDVLLFAQTQWLGILLKCVQPPDTLGNESYSSISVQKLALYFAEAMHQPSSNQKITPERNQYQLLPSIYASLIRVIESFEGLFLSERSSYSSTLHLEEFIYRKYLVVLEMDVYKHLEMLSSLKDTEVDGSSTLFSNCLKFCDILSIVIQTGQYLPMLDRTVDKLLSTCLAFYLDYCQNLVKKLSTSYDTRRILSMILAFDQNAMDLEQAINLPFVENNHLSYKEEFDKMCNKIQNRSLHPSELFLLPKHKKSIEKLCVLLATLEHIIKYLEEIPSYTLGVAKHDVDAFAKAFSKLHETLWMALRYELLLHIYYYLDLTRQMPPTCLRPLPPPALRLIDDMRRLLAIYKKMIPNQALSKMLMGMTSLIDLTLVNFFPDGRKETHGLFCDALEAFFVPYEGTLYMYRQILTKKDAAIKRQ